MKKLIMLLLFSVCVILCADSPLHAGIRTEKGLYYVDGIECSATIKDGKKAAAREEVKKIAYRYALEAAMNECLPGMSETERYNSIREKVFSRGTGAIKNYKAKETVEGDTLMVNASCTVNVSTLNSLLEPEIVAMLGNPRVMIIVDERIGGKAPFMSTVESELIRIFQKHGYLIVDKEQAEVLLSLDPQKSFNDPTMLANAAKTLRADIIIVARATGGSTAHTKLYGINMYKTGGSVQVKAVLTQTAYQITSTTYSGGSGKNWVGSSTSGLSGVFSRGAVRAAEEIMYKIAYKLASQHGGVTVNVKLAGASFKEAENIEERLRSFVGPSGNVFERSFSGGVAEIDVVSGKTASNVASFLSDYTEVTGRTAQTVTARMRVATVTATTPVTVIELNIHIDNVTRESTASDLKDEIMKFIGASGKVSSAYTYPALEIKVVCPSGEEREKISGRLGDFLKAQDIRVDSMSDSAVKGWHKSWW